MRYVVAIIALLLICVWADSMQGQQAKPPVVNGTGATFPPTTQPGVTVSDASYPFPPEEKAKIRDIQYESDQLEIQNQKLQLQIEHNKARQAQLFDQERLVAFNFATARKINLDLYELDAVQVKFIKKQPPKK